MFRRVSESIDNWKAHSNASDPPHDSDLLPATKDAVFTSQLHASDFQRLEPEALILANIVFDKSRSGAEKILEACKKLEIIDPATGRPQTNKITRGLMSALPKNVSFVRQKLLVMLLFFWEEECVRWRLLESQEKDLITRGGDVERPIEALKAEKKVLPSLRDQSGKVFGEEEEEALPTYAEARRGT